VKLKSHSLNEHSRIKKKVIWQFPSQGNALDRFLLALVFVNWIVTKKNFNIQEWNITISYRTWCYAIFFFWSSLLLFFCWSVSFTCSYETIHLEGRQDCSDPHCLVDIEWQSLNKYRVMIYLRPLPWESIAIRMTGAASKARYIRMALWCF